MIKKFTKSYFLNTSIKQIIEDIDGEECNGLDCDVCPFNLDQGEDVYGNSIFECVIYQIKENIDNLED